MKTLMLMALALGLAVTTGTSPAVAAPKAKTYPVKISCKAASVRAQPTQHSERRGTVYRGDSGLTSTKRRRVAGTDSYHLWLLARWNHKGHRLTGWVILRCVDIRPAVDAVLAEQNSA